MKTKEFIKLIEDADFMIQDSDGYLYVSKVNHSGYTSGLYGRVSKKHEYCFDTNYIPFAQLCTDIRGLITSALYAYSQTPIEERESIELLPAEPSKIVIPKFVADWWGRDADSVTMYGGDSIDKKRKINIISNFNDSGLADHLSKVEDWIYENESTFLDLVNGKPYEVEKEQLYYVLDKQGKTLLALIGGEVCISGGYVLSEGTANKDIYQLTEKQIKDYDQRFWSFAKEVTE